MAEDLRQAALDYHRKPKPGKLGIHATKRMSTQRDLALAYSPGVAAACEEIAKDPTRAWDYTVRANLVAVISNGSAVLGLGSIGALASKPVMEGKAVLFKKFANIDVFDIEVDEGDVDALVETIARLEPTFGAINLEDIKAPECFEVERRLKERLNIPVFHDDQHGTAICVAAAALNALRIVGKTPDAVRLVCSGAGAAAIACLDLLRELGVAQHNISVCDRKGVVHAGRTDLNEQKKRYALDTDERTLDDAIAGADIFLGLSGPGTMTQAMVRSMGPKPIILALANPTPEIMPEDALAARPDAIIATGRSDYPNQVNNVLCFPFIFRGRARLRSDRDQHGDEARLRARDCRPGDRRILRCRGRGLWRPVAEIRPRLHHPEALRSAPDRDRADRRDRGGDGERSRGPADRRPRGLSGRACGPRIPHRLLDEGGVRPGQAGPAKGGLRRRPERACAARRPAGHRRGHRAADPDRAAVPHRGADRTALAPASAGDGRRGRRSGALRKI